jgi:hypothetical protein
LLEKVDWKKFQQALYGEVPVEGLEKLESLIGNQRVGTIVLILFILFYFIFNFILFCFVLFCFVLFCFVLFCFVLFCFVLFCFIFILFCFIFILFCFILFYFILFVAKAELSQGTQMNVVTMARFYQIWQWFGPFYDKSLGKEIVKEVCSSLFFLSFSFLIFIFSIADDQVTRGRVRIPTSYFYF